MCRKTLLFIVCVLVLSMAGNAAAELVAYWTFDEGSGDTVIDSTGNGNDGTLMGAQWGEGKFGNALEFNGADQYVEVYQKLHAEWIAVQQAWNAFKNEEVMSFQSMMQNNAVGPLIMSKED